MNAAKAGSGLLTALEAPRVVNRIDFTSANNDAGNDPTRFVLLGSNTPLAWDSTAWTPVASAATGLSTDRGATNSVGFANSQSFQYYKLVFTELRSADAEAMQIAGVYLEGMLPPGQGFDHVAVAPAGQQMAALSNAGLVAISRDGGRDWTLVRAPADDYTDVLITDDGRVLLADRAGGGTPGNLRELAADGRSWTTLNLPSRNWQDLTVAGNTLLGATGRASSGAGAGGIFQGVVATLIDSVTASSGNVPSGEGAANVADGNSASKYLNRDKVGSGLVFTLSQAEVVNSLQFTSANDASERDPMTFTVFGSNGPSEWSSAAWTQVGQGNTGLGTARRTEAAAVSFANTTAYKHYKVVMTSLRNNAAATSMQVAEIKLGSNGTTIAAGLGQNGIAWTDVTRGALNNGDWLSVSADASGLRWVASTTGGQLFYADTSAANWKWTPVGALGQGTRVAISADGTALVATASGNSGGVWISRDLGTSWVQAAGRGEMGVSKGSEWVGASIDGATGMTTALAKDQPILRFAAPSPSAALNLSLPDTLMVAGDEATPLTFPAGSLYDADLLRTAVAGDNTPNVSVQFDVTQGAFGVSAADATRLGVAVQATASGVKLSATVAKLSSFLSGVGNLQFMPGDNGIIGPLVVTLSDGVNTVVREVPLVVQKPVALKASYNAGNFEILGTSGNALRLSRSPLDEVRLGLLADELTVVRLADVPLVVRASEGADQITMDLGNTVAADGLARTLRLEDVDNGPSEMRDDTLSLRFKPVASSTTKNVVTLANGKLVSGIENIVWDETLGTLRLSGDSIVIKAEPDAPIDLGDTRLVVDAKTLVIEGDLRIKDAGSLVLNISEKITLAGLKQYGVNGAADSNFAVQSVMSKDANGKLLAMVVQSVKIEAPPPGQTVDLTAYAAPGTGLQVTPQAGVAISLGGAGGGLALDPSKLTDIPVLVIGSSGGSNPVAMGGGGSTLAVSVPLTIQSQGTGGKVAVAGSVKGKTLSIFGPGNTTVFADGTQLSLSDGATINDAIRFDGAVTLAMGDAQANQAGNFHVTGRVNGGTGLSDVLSLSAYKGSITIDGRIGDGIGDTASSIRVAQSGRNFGADTSEAVANQDGSFTYKGVVLTGGSGSGATADITVKDGSVSAVSLVSVGGGYEVGDVLTAARSQLGDLVARSAADRDAWALRLEVLQLSSLEGLVVSDAMNVTFGERLYVDGDVTIQATGKVVFSDEVVLRGGGQLVISGTREVEFLQGIRFEKDAQGQAGSLSVSSADTSVSFLYGLFAGQNDAMRWAGVSSLLLEAPEAAGEKGSLTVIGGALVLQEAPGFVNLNLNLDTLSLTARSLTMPASTTVTVNMDLDLLAIEADAGIGAANALLKVNADRIEARAADGDVFLEISGSDEVVVYAQTRDQGTIGIGAAQDLRLSSASVLDTTDLSLSAQRDLYLPSISAQDDLILNAGRHMNLSGSVTADGLRLGSAAGVVTQANGANLTITGATVLTAGVGATANLTGANQFGGAITVSGSGTVNASDVDALDVVLDNAGSASLVAGGTLSLRGSATVASGHISTQAAAQTQLGATQVSGRLTVVSTGTISQSGALTVSGASRFDTRGLALRLLGANNFGGALNLDASSAEVNDVNALELGTVNVGGDLTLTAAGAVTDSGVLSVGGQTRITAQNITLDSVSDFVGTVHLTASQVSVRDANAIKLGQMTLDSLTVVAGTSIAQSGAFTVTGASQLSAASILLDRDNDFGGAIALGGGSATINDINAVDFGVVDIRGDLTLTAAGAVTNSGVLKVDGQTIISAQNITLDGANDFGGVVTLTGAQLHLNDSNALSVVLQASSGANLAAGGDLAVGGAVTGGLIIGAGGEVELGQTTVGADLTVRAGTDFKQVGSVQVSGLADLGAGGAIELGQANRWGGPVTASARDIALHASGNLTMGSVRADNTVHLSSAAGSITLTIEPRAAVLSLDAAGAVSGAGAQSLSAQTVSVSAGQSLGSRQSPLQLTGHTLTVSSSAGDVYLGLSRADAIGARVSAAGEVVIDHTGSLRFAAGSTLTSQQGGISLQAPGDLWVSGLTLSAEQAQLQAGQAIKAQALENAQPLGIDGELHLQAQTGIGGFDFERVLIDQLGPNTRVSAHNSAGGDVVIAGLRGLTVSERSIETDPDDWVVLLGGRGAIEEQGQLLTRTNLVRATGVNWLARSQIETSLLVTAVIKSGAMEQQGASVIDRLNQLLAQGWSAGSDQDAPALDNGAQVLTTNARSTVRVGADRQSSAATISVMASPKSATQLLEMAMTLSQQGANPMVGETESLSGWVVRTNNPPADAARDPAATPRTEPARVTPPADPAAAPTDGSTNLPANAPTAEPGADKAPDAPPSPTSDVKWLLPEAELAPWQSSDRPNEPAAQVGMMASIKGAALKIGQWLGWSGDRTPPDPQATAPHEQGKVRGQGSEEA